MNRSSHGPHPVRRAATFGLLLLVLLGAGVFLLRDQLLQDGLRPLLVRELSRRFQVELAIGHLLLRDGTIRIEQLSLRDDAFGRLEVPLIEIQLDWADVRARRVSRLVLSGPRLTWSPAEAGSGTGPAAWPKQPPLNIEEIVIRDGELRYPVGTDERWSLEGKGTLGRRWRLDLDLQAGAASGQTIALQAQGSWDGVIRGEVTRAQWQDRQLLVTPLQLTLADGTLTRLSGALQLDRLSDALLRPLLAGLGQPLSGALSWRAEKLRINFGLEDGELRLTGQLAAFEIGTRRQTVLKGIELTGRGSAGQPLDFQVAARLGADAGSVAAAGRIAWNDPPRLELERFDWRGQPLLTRPLRFSWQGGATNLTAALQLNELDDRSLRPLLELADVRLPPDPHWSVRELVVRPNWDGERLQLEMKAASATILNGGRQVKLAPVALQIDGGPGSWQLHGAGDLEERSRLRIDLQLRGDALEGRTDLESADLAGLRQAQPEAGFPELSGAGSATVQIGGTTESPRLKIRISGHDLSVPNAPGNPALDLQAELLLKQEPAGWRLRDGSLNGNLSGSLEASLAGTFNGSQGEDGWSVRLAELRIGDPTWTASDGLSAFAGQNMRFRGELTARDGKGPRFELTGEFEGGELLHGSYYASLGELSARFGVQGKIEGQNWRIEQARLEVPRFGELALNGNFGPNEGRFQGMLSLPNLRQALESHGRKLVGDSFPGLKDLSLGGGLEIKAEGRRDQRGWGLRLDLEPRLMNLDLGERIHIAGLDGRLPLQLGSLDMGSDQSGRLNWTGLSLGPLQSDAVELDFLSRPGRLQLAGTLLFGLAGGGLALTDLDLALPPQTPDFSARVTVADVELRQLNHVLGWPEMEGVLAADLGRLHYNGGELSIDGTAVIEVFAGEIRVRNMLLQELFTRYPVFLADIDFFGIDLNRLTRTFSFGEMNGIVDGYVHQLRLFGTTPTRFEAELHSRDSGTRNISVKALNNISTLSQGGLSAALSRGIYQFIDFYRYRSLGIFCSLKNDRFHLRGTALKDSDRYLVYGGLLPPRINIVSSVSTVSFREMVKRLKRIDRSGSS